MARLIAFHGTPAEGVELLVAIGHHCTCDRDPETGMTHGGCPVHLMLSDQRILDRLLDSRRRAAKLAQEENR